MSMFFFSGHIEQVKHRVFIRDDTLLPRSFYIYGASDFGWTLKHGLAPLRLHVCISKRARLTRSDLQSTNREMKSVKQKEELQSIIECEVSANSANFPNDLHKPLGEFVRQLLVNFKLLGFPLLP